MATDIHQPLQGKTVVITGATSGIGQVGAERLAQLGARIVFVARDRARGEAMLARLRSLSPGCEPSVYYADLSLVAQMKLVATQIAAAEPRIDVLINNAGALFAKRQLTSEGLERTFATNHLAYFVLTNLLLERLRGVPDARIVSTSSAAHRRGQINFADLQWTQGYRGFTVYGCSKLMNILFTRQLARRLGDSGVTANCLHPGFVATRFGDGNGGLMAFALKCAKRLGALTPEQGARTLIYLAASGAVAGHSGDYFSQCRPATTSARAQSDDDARRLWDLSVQLTGVGA